MISSAALHRVAEVLMGMMDEAATKGDYSMAAAYARMAAVAEARAFRQIPADRQRTRQIIDESRWALVAKVVEFEAKSGDAAALST